MEIPFSTEEFLEIFRKYNTAIWPGQVFLYILAFIAISLIFRKTHFSSEIIAIILSFLWLWMGVIYHLIYFTEINNAAYLFAFVFIFQAILLLYLGVIRKKISFLFHPGFYGFAGAFFVFFALIFYPIISNKMGHVYPSMPTFGLPCPTTIFSFGMLMWADKKTPLIIYIIPLGWVMIGFLAAISLGMSEDFGLLIAGIFTISKIVVSQINKDKKILSPR